MQRYSVIPRSQTWRPLARWWAAALALIALPAAWSAEDSGLAALDEAGLVRHIRVLGSDEFEGRAPFSAGEEKTIDYLAREFRRLGLLPGNGESYFQPVPLVELTAEPDAVLKVVAGDHALSFAYGKDAMLWTKREQESVTLEDSELVFVGYGIVAPEYHWNDYQGLDVAGKTVVMLVNDPGFASGDQSLFNGKAMTYYGRWTYKFEEAARQGAVAALIVHEPVAAAYPWEVVTGSWSGPQFDLQRPNGNADRVAIEGWLHLDAARRLFASAGLDLETEMAAAAAAGYRWRSLQATASTELRNTIRRSRSHNVVARIPGRERPAEALFYMAHWDHLGSDPELAEDPIYNGALDNASGLAALLELAEALSAREPARSVWFLATTAEESGLLGSAYYAENPLLPLAQTVAGINIDGVNIFGPTRDVAVVGFGSSQLEDYLRPLIEAQERVMVPESNPERGGFFRSDHFSFAKHGVPVLYAGSGVDDRDHGRDWGLARRAEYIAERYHKPGDEYSPSWDLRGAVEDLRLYYQLGVKIAESDLWPRWYPGSEFRARREASMAGD